MTEDPNAFQHLRRAAEPFIDKCVQRSFNSENAEWIRRTRWRLDGPEPLEVSPGFADRLDAALPPHKRRHITRGRQD